jgi:hypothetical protein
MCASCCTLRSCSSLMSTSPTPLFYAQATAAEQHQALLGARQVLDAAFPHVSPAQWAAALTQTNPALLVAEPGPVRPSHEGLAGLVYHLATSPLPAPAAGPMATDSPAPAADLTTGLLASRKQTYAIPDDVRAQLANLSYWSRIPINRLVVQALRQYLAQHPAAYRPRPADDSPLAD